jgi:exopolysaccharide biosynthesis polyprenyl glycosylphosphotransferase
MTAATETWVDEPGVVIDLVPKDKRHVSRALRHALIASDAIALSAAWLIAYLLASDLSTSQALVQTAVITVAGVWLIRRQHLYRSRVASMRTVELARLTRVVAILGVLAACIAWFASDEDQAAAVIAGSLIALVALVTERTAFRNWLKTQRSRGRFCRPVLLVGIDDQTRSLRQLLEEHPDLGFKVVGAVGDRNAARDWEVLDLWRGTSDECADLIASGTATGAVMSATALQPDELNRCVRSLLEQGAHVHLSPGVRGIDHRRLRAVHIGYEPLFYIEAADLTRSQLATKRALDLVLSSLAMVVAAPLMLIGAIAIKLQDRGPVLFRQTRVGRDGELFTVLKLRTMAVGAEEQLDELLAFNGRNGPLFKMEDDPRVTRVGRILRALSIDEFPQFFNVLRGDMSLVGPRPALPAEAAVFSDRLKERTKVLPGITGLWQVEARDNPSFSVYERLDVFYVENWSVTLDLVIMFNTIESEVSRILRWMFVRSSSRPGSKRPSAVGVR